MLIVATARYPLQAAPMRRDPLNLAYRWFCRLGLDGGVPDHSTLSKNRHRQFRQSDLLRRLFETVLGRCISEGLVGCEGFAVDASLIKADANRQKGIEGKKGLRRKPQAVRSRSIWLCSMTLHSALRAKLHPSSSHRPIRRRAKPEPMAGRPSLPIPPTI